MAACQKAILGAALELVYHLTRNLTGPRPCSVLYPLAHSQDLIVPPEVGLSSVELSVALATILEAGLGLHLNIGRYLVVEAEARPPDATEHETIVGPQARLLTDREVQRSVLLSITFSGWGAEADGNQKIVVEKLTKNVTESHLREIFGGFGDIQSLDLPMNKACRCIGLKFTCFFSLTHHQS